MAVLMPIAGRLYDKIGMRWLAVPGMALAGYGTWLLTDINPDMTEGDVVLWTCVRAAGMGLAMMPVMTGGMAILPQSAVNQGSAWNNVSRQVAGAIGLAAVSAMASIQQAQLLADRSAFITAGNLAHYGCNRPRRPGAATCRACTGCTNAWSCRCWATPTGTSSWSQPCSARSVRCWPSRCRPGRRRRPPPLPPSRPSTKPEPEPAAPDILHRVEEPRPHEVVGQGASR